MQLAVCGIEEHGQTVPAARGAWIGGAGVGGAGSEGIVEWWRKCVDVFAMFFVR